MSKKAKIKTEAEICSTTDAESNKKLDCGECDINDQIWNDIFLTKGKIIIERDEEGEIIVHQIRTMRIDDESMLKSLDNYRDSCLGIVNYHLLAKRAIAEEYALESQNLKQSAKAKNKRT